MGSCVAELDWSTSPAVVMAAQRLVSLALMVLVYACYVEMTPLVKRSPDALSLAEGNAEPITALNGFYGNPLYRPYGFGAWTLLMKSVFGLDWLIISHAFMLQRPHQP